MAVSIFEFEMPLFGQAQWPRVKAIGTMSIDDTSRFLHAGDQPS